MICYTILYQMVHFKYLRQMCRVKGDVYESYGGRNYQRDRRD